MNELGKSKDVRSLQNSLDFSQVAKEEILMV